VLANTLFYFVPEKEMKLTKPEIQLSFSADKDETVIKLKSNVLAKDLFLSNKENNGFFSDNFFDLIPGEEKTIRFKPYKKVDLKNEIVLKSLFDTF
jgi:beta-mannosidase